MSTDSNAHAKFGHLVPIKVSAMILGALVALTIITVVAASHDFGAASINIIIAMTIASIKATLVALWFMHLKFEDVAIWVFILTPFLLLAILIGFTLTDVFSRIFPGLSF